MSWLPPPEVMEVPADPGSRSARALDEVAVFEEELLLLPLDSEEAEEEAAAAEAAPGPSPMLVREISELVHHDFRLHRPEAASFPSLALQVLDLAEDPEVSLRDLVDLLRNDAAISARLIGIANSAAFHRGNEITTLWQAANLLGTRAITQIALGVACRSLYDSGVREEMEYYPGLWKSLFTDSMTVAYTASELVVARHLGDGEQAFLAGLLVDVGKSLALRSLSTLSLQGFLAPLDPPLLDRVVDQVHVELGVEALTAWGIPRSQVVICRCHHDAQVPPCDEENDVHLVRVVGGLRDLSTTPSLARQRARQVRDSAVVLGFNDEELVALQSVVADNAERVEQLFATRH